MAFTKAWCDSVLDATAAQEKAQFDKEIDERLEWYRLADYLEKTFAPNSGTKHYQIDISTYADFVGCRPAIYEWVRAQRKKMSWCRNLWIMDRRSTLITEDNVDSLPEVIRPYLRCIIEKGYRLYFCHEGDGSDAHCLCIRYQKKK